tara:strand:- start:513 stop:1976 length:1464 start_codon:yes stop_codon:yes gene_type:complete
MAKNITKKDANYSQWYNDIVMNADLAENSAVRGCMVIKPYGFAIWERLQSELDKMFKDTGHMNAYFPLFIPKSFFSKEANHVDGFAKECAVVTHYRLKNSKEGIVVDEDAKLEEELIVRPTSETIIWDTYKKWIQSYRDLPILVNQWANVVRWEMRTRLFLRTSEFLWQEGHTAHETKKEAKEETTLILNLYADFLEKFMAIPVLKGKKTDSERFAGAIDTLCIEALMQDGKALQAGTSHFLGQNFSKAFDVKFNNRDGKLEHVWSTSWGVSTRLMGALIMTHSDDQGLVLPPQLAPFQVVIVPIYKGKEEFENIDKFCKKIQKDLQKVGIRVKYDNRDSHKPGWKFNEYEVKGVPIRLSIGKRDIQEGKIEVFRRDKLEKYFFQSDKLTSIVKKLLEEIQFNLYNKANVFLEKNTHSVDKFDDFQKIIKQGGFILAHWDGTEETEVKIKKLTKATIRCIPFDNFEDGKCIMTGNPSKQRVLFAKAY